MLGEQNMLSRNPGGTDFRAINMRPGSSLPLWTIKAVILSLAKSITNDAQLKGIVHPEKKIVSSFTQIKCVGTRCTALSDVAYMRINGAWQLFL